MKKAIALLLISSVLLAGCTSPDVDETETTESSSDDLFGREIPHFDVDPVDVTEHFDTFYAEPVDIPWVLENNIPFTHGNVSTYFNQFVCSNGLRSEVEGCEIYGDTAVIYRPVVQHYPADEPGYTVYEINYTEVFPVSCYIPDSAGANWGTTFEYHNVAYIDYYTGMEYPYVNLSSDINSFCVYGDVVYNDQTYTVYYYSYRSAETANRSQTYDENGTFLAYDRIIYQTDYFIVPDGYDGLVMYVYTADDTDRSFGEAQEDNNPYFTSYTLFGKPGSDEYIDDYTFLSIAELG